MCEDVSVAICKTPCQTKLSKKKKKKKHGREWLEDVLFVEIWRTDLRSGKVYWVPWQSEFHSSLSLPYLPLLSSLVEKFFPGERYCKLYNILKAVTLTETRVFSLTILYQRCWLACLGSYADPLRNCCGWDVRNTLIGGTRSRGHREQGGVSHLHYRDKNY